MKLIKTKADHKEAQRTLAAFSDKMVEKLQDWKYKGMHSEEKTRIYTKLSLVRRDQRDAVNATTHWWSKRQRLNRKEIQKIKQTNKNSFWHHMRGKGVERYLGYLTPKQNQLYLCHCQQRYGRTVIYSSFKDLEYRPLHDFLGKSISMLH